MATRHILFVCTGNTGRSVAAEALTRCIAAERGWALSVSSRGVAVDPANRNAERHVVTLLAARGLDVSTHQAQQLTAADIDAADQVLTMTAAHKQRLLTRFPDAAPKVRMLSDAACGTHEDVPDAFGASVGVYERMLATLDGMIELVLRPVSSEPATD